MGSEEPSAKNDTQSAGGRLTTPMAILIGSAMIAIALFLALRPSRDSQQPVPTSLPVEASSRATTDTKHGESTVPPQPTAPPAAPQPSISRDQVIQQASEVLNQAKAKLIERCWKPAIQQQAKPPMIKYVFNFTFDAQGNQVMRGVVEDRETARPEVTQCVLSLLPVVKVAALGANTYVEVPFQLP